MVPVVNVELADGSFIEPFKNPQGWPVVDLVFTESYLVALLGEDDLTRLDFEIWAWNPDRPAEPAWLVHKREPDTVQGGFIRIRAQGDQLTWLEPGPSQQEQSVPVYDLANRQIRFAAQEAFAYGPTWDDDVLVWQQVTEGEETLTGLNADSTQWQAPRQLAEMVAAAEFVVSDGVWFWTNRDRNLLYAWTEGWDSPELIDVAAGSGEWFDSLSTTDGFVFYYGHHQTWVADTSTRSRAPMTDQYGAASVPRPGQLSMIYYGPDVIDRYGAQQRIWDASELSRLNTCD